MIKVDDKTVEIRGKLLEIINDLINVMKVIRKAEDDERRVDELLTIAIEFSKKNPREITPEYEKTVCEIVRERLSKEAPIEDWSKVQVDTKVWVRDGDEEQWKPRYFAKYENGKVYAWHDGATSFSAQNSKACICWKYVKLAEENDD